MWWKAVSSFIGNAKCITHPMHATILQNRTFGMELLYVYILCFYKVNYSSLFNGLNVLYAVNNNNKRNSSKFSNNS